MKKTSLWLGAFSALALLLAVAEAKVLINGAGATFPEVIYTKWFQEFPKKYPDSQINYQALGSGAGAWRPQAPSAARASTDRATRG